MIILLAWFHNKHYGHWVSYLQIRTFIPYIWTYLRRCLCVLGVEGGVTRNEWPMLSMIRDWRLRVYMPHMLLNMWGTCTCVCKCHSLVQNFFDNQYYFNESTQWNWKWLVMLAMELFITIGAREERHIWQSFLWPINNNYLPSLGASKDSTPKRQKTSSKLSQQIMDQFLEPKKKKLKK